MKNRKLIQFVESFILLPGLTLSGLSGATLSHVPLNTGNTSSTVSSQKLNIRDSATLALNDAVDTKAEAEQAKADAIDAYFTSNNMPLAGLGMKMVQEAEKNDLDWRLLPAIAVRESTGGLFACQKATFNPFGWGSCKISFSSNENAIETVALNLGGNNPATAKHYDNKTTKQILHAYNPPSVIPRYAEQVMSIMNTIGAPDTTPVASA